MNRIHLAVGVMLAAALPALSTGARAAPIIPRAIAAGAPAANYVLVQGYGGGQRDDDEDEPHQRMHVQPRYDRPHGGGGGNGNGAIIMQQIIRGIGEAARQQHLREERDKYIKQEQQLERQRAIDDQKRRIRAAEQERLKRAKQDEINKLRRQEKQELDAERDRLKKLHKQRQDQIDEEKAAEDKKNKQEKYSNEHNNNNNDNYTNNNTNNNNNSNYNSNTNSNTNNNSFTNNNNNRGGGNNNPNNTNNNNFTNNNNNNHGSTNNNNTNNNNSNDSNTNNNSFTNNNDNNNFNNNNNNFNNNTNNNSYTNNNSNENYTTTNNNNNDSESYPSELENHVHVTVTLCPRDDRPPVNAVPPLPVSRDKQLPACGYVSLPPDRDLCSGRTASGAWLRVVNVPTAGGGSRPVCMSYCTNPPVTQSCVTPPVHTEETHKHLTPAIQTSKADPTYEPEHKHLTPAIQTSKADPTYEPEHKHLTPAIQTSKADPTYEPEHKHLTPAIQTGKADPTTEPEHKHLTPAIQTGKADPTTEPEHKHLTPAIQTGKADPTTEPEHKHLTHAIRTAKASSTVEPEHEHLTPAESTGAAGSYVEPEHKREHKRGPQHGSLTPAVLTPTAASYTEPKRQRPDGNLHEPAFEFDSIALPPASDKPVPKLDGDNCMATDNTSLPQYVSPSNVRQLVTEGAAAIPRVGDAINFVMDLFWPDGSQSQFTQMKNYVDQLVPAAIAQYDKTQLQNDLAYLIAAAGEMKHTRTLSTKADDLKDIVSRLGEMDQRFRNSQSPTSTLAEFVTFGTLYLMALKEKYDHYDEYYPIDRKDAKAVSDHEGDREDVRSKLNKLISDYQTHVAAIKEALVKDRQDKVKLNDRGEVHSVFFSVDAPEALVTNDYYSVKDRACNWQGPEYEDNKFLAFADVVRRQAAVKATYDALIDQLTAPIAQWKKLAAPVMQSKKM